MEPINYMAMMPQVDFTQRFNQGLQMAQNIAQLSAMGEAKTQQEQVKTDLQSFFSKPNKTVEDYEQMRLKYPSMSEALTASYKTVNEEKKLNDFNIASQISGALNSGNTDLAKQILTKEKEAYLNSGDTKGAGSMDNILKTIDSSPNTALEMSNMFMASIYPDKFKDTYEGIIKNQQAPLESEKLKQEIINKAKDSGLKEAQTAKVWQEYKTAPIDTNIKLQQLQLDKENSKIRLMEAQLRNTDNDLKSQELQLKIDEKKQTIEKLKQENETNNSQMLSDAKSSFDTISQTQNTVNSILKSPGLEMATGATNILSAIPGTDAKNTAALVDTLKSQAFLSQVSKMKGTGALSENEGKKITDALGSLDLGQSKDHFIKTLNIITDTLNNAKGSLEIKYKNQLPQIQEIIKKEEEDKAKKDKLNNPIQQSNMPKILTPDQLKSLGGGFR